MAANRMVTSRGKALGPRALMLALAVLGILAFPGHEDSVAAQAPPTADLTAFDIQTSAKDVWRGNTIEISSLVSNRGNATARNVTVIFYDGSRKIAERNVAELEPGANQEVVAMWATGKAALGRHTIRVMVDPKDAIIEGNETNNEASTKVTIEENPLMTYSIPLLLLVAIVGILGYKAYTWAVLRRIRNEQKLRKGGGKAQTAVGDGPEEE
jgi:hypothetical protein